MKFFRPENILPDNLTQCLVLYSNGEVHEGIYIGGGTFRMPEWVMATVDTKVVGWCYMVDGELEDEEESGTDA